MVEQDLYDLLSFFEKLLEFKNVEDDLVKENWVKNTLNELKKIELKFSINNNEQEINSGYYMDNIFSELLIDDNNLDKICLSLFNEIFLSKKPDYEIKELNDLDQIIDYLINNENLNIEIEILNFCLSYKMIIIYLNDGFGPCINFCRKLSHKYKNSLRKLSKILTELIMIDEDLKFSNHKILEIFLENNWETKILNYYKKLNQENNPANKKAKICEIIETGLKNLEPMLNECLYRKGLPFKEDDELIEPICSMGVKPFHDIFVCPILKNAAWDEENYPIRIPCGHVISAKALNGILNNSNLARCPYCKITFIKSEIIEIKL